MPQTLQPYVENNFTQGLKTEFTGLNFPENAATDTDNCIYTLTGEVLRRSGIDAETGYFIKNNSRLDQAITTYKWRNAGGDGITEILVEQIGNILFFYKTSAMTLANPALSSQIISYSLDLTSFETIGFNTITECDYADGNGYLFVFHPNIQPIYISFDGTNFVAKAINIQVRDFSGVPETGIPINLRPSVLSAEHQYNLNNQGWTQGSAWATQDTSSTVAVGLGSKVFTVASGLTITNGDTVAIAAPGSGLPGNVMGGTVTGYTGTSLTLNITYAFTPVVGTIYPTYAINQNNVAGYINTWHTAEGNYPSNADVWWSFKDDTGVFNPATTQVTVTLSSSPAPRGHFILDPFNQQRSAVSGNAITPIFTGMRPKTGCWFQGRVWYAGVDASSAATGDVPFYTWTENIYFSQIVIDSTEFGMCYQTNDPTSEDLLDELPTDGGVITIQGAGTVYKLFPVQNGLLVFASNGIYFITGSQGIGFSANDYTVTKISDIRVLSAQSFVNVLGWPVFWNIEGIYTVAPSQQGGGLAVTNLCYGTILTYYNDIPNISKVYARGDYNPIDFVISWVFRSTPEQSFTDRFSYDRVLNFNTANKAFYPYSFDTPSTVHIHGIKFVAPIASSSAPEPAFKYIISQDVVSNSNFTFAEENDSTNWLDFMTLTGGIDYTSYFVTGYKLHGQGLRKFQPIYVNMFSKTDFPTAYKIRGIWDYAGDPNSGKYSSFQLTSNSSTRFNNLYKRHKIRGHGLALQLNIESVSGKPFHIIGWSSIDSQNTGM